MHADDNLLHFLQCQWQCVINTMGIQLVYYLQHYYNIYNRNIQGITIVYNYSKHIETKIVHNY